LHLERIARAPRRQAFDRSRDLRLKRQQITGVGQVVVASKTFEQLTRTIGVSDARLCEPVSWSVVFKTFRIIAVLLLLGFWHGIF
jgi:hypothetical protein